MPLGVVAAIGIGGFVLYENREAQQLRDRIATAQRNSTPEGKEWIVFSQPDPASDIEIARTASIKSNDGLCSLTVQKRINGSELTGLRCPGIKISEYEDIYVKFDTYETSKKMQLESYTDSDDVYIPSYQYEYSGNLSYKEFIKGLVTANSVAIKVPSADSFWVRFTLKGSTAAINLLGKPIPSANKQKQSDA